MLRRMNLQLFAADDGAGSTDGQEATSQVQGDNSNQDDGSEKQASNDQVREDEVSELKKQLEEKDKEYKENLKKEVEKALKEEKRLSKLSQDEREQEEKEKRLKQLEEREKALIFKEKLADVKDELIKRKLPTIFADYLVDEDNAKSLEKLNEFENSFKKAVQDEVDSKITGVSLKNGETSNVKDVGSAMAKMLNEKTNDVFNPWK